MLFDSGVAPACSTPTAPAQEGGEKEECSSQTHIKHERDGDAVCGGEEAMEKDEQITGVRVQTALTDTERYSDWM
uniref:Uncharacterized protein n=1 Tax=Knipowitschia caucasica TaxID=637954 RepID=A0AAV2MSL6_KNICA